MKFYLTVIIAASVACIANTILGIKIPDWPYSVHDLIYIAGGSAIGYVVGRESKDNKKASV